MKIIYILALLTFVMITISCRETKPICPELPYYPQAQLTNFETPTVSRIASYQTTDTPGQVLNYYKHHLLNSGWELVNDIPEGITFFYINREKVPPFSLDVVITTTQPGVTDFKVHLTMGGPYNWSNWCQTLRP